MHIIAKPLVFQIIRFGLVGVINTGIAYAIYALLLYLGLSYVIANFGSLVMGICVSFFSQGRFVFGNSAINRLPRFIVLWVTLYFVNIGLISILLRHGFNAYVGGALALIPITLLSFICQRYLVFRPARASL